MCIDNIKTYIHLPDKLNLYVYKTNNACYFISFNMYVNFRELININPIYRPT